MQQGVLHQSNTTNGGLFLEAPRIADLSSEMTCGRESRHLAHAALRPRRLVIKKVYWRGSCPEEGENKFGESEYLYKKLGASNLDFY